MHHRTAPEILSPRLFIYADIWKVTDHEVICNGGGNQGSAVFAVLPGVVALPRADGGKLEYAIQISPLAGVLAAGLFRLSRPSGMCVIVPLSWKTKGVMRRRYLAARTSVRRPMRCRRNTRPATSEVADAIGVSGVSPVPTNTFEGDR